MAAPQQFEDLDGAEVDLVVIGGGVTGAGVAFDAALRGANVVLCEQRDFASGTSSRSSKLIHGGLRYLEQGEFGLIYEAVNERRRLRRLARHLVRPLRFYFPRYEGQSPGPGLMRIGLLIYEAMVGFRVDGLHRKLSPERTLAEQPALRAEGLEGCLSYFDAKAADARLVWETVLGARQAGAGVFNYCEVEAADPVSDGWEVQIRHRVRDEVLRLRSRAVVACVGPWANEALRRFFPERGDVVRPTKGVHLVFETERLPVRDAVTLQHPDDGRVLFAINGRGYVYAGTTDTDYEGPLDEPGVTADDVAYVLRALNAYFPDAELGPGDVTGTWSGLRPLINEEGKLESQVSREHEIKRLEPGFFSVEGGKLTTYRAMAEEAVDLALSWLDDEGRGRDWEPCLTRREPLPGGRGITSEEDLERLRSRVSQWDGLSSAEAEHLVSLFGSRVLEVLPMLDAEPERAIPDLPYRWGELQFVIEHESVEQVEDLMLRRTEIYYQDPASGLSICDEVAARIGRARGRSEAWVRDSAEAYRRRVAEGVAFRNHAPA